MESKLDLDASIGLTGTRRSSSPWSEEVAAGILAITDFFAVLAAGILANAVVYADSARLFDHAAGTLLCGVAVVHSKSLFRLYDSVQTKRLLPLLDRLLVSLIVAYGAVVLVAHISDVPASSYPPRWKLALFVFSLVMVLLGRVAFIAGVATLSKRGLLSRNVAIVGATEYTTMLIDQVERRFGPSTHILGVLDEEASGDRPLGQPGDGSAVHGTTEDLVSLAQKVRVDEIFVALPASAQTRIDSIVSKIQVIPANIHFCAIVAGAMAVNRERRLSNMDGLPVVTMVSKPVSGWGYLIKWLLDKSLASLGLILLSPLLLVVALLIKLESAGPVFFRQPRLGFNNKPILVYKFRSMYHAQQDMGANRLATKNDPRVTRIGRFIRRTSIDELPQLLNVLRGDMSLVGPRPHALEAKAAGLLYHDIVAGYALRHKIKPGITGWAQVNGWRGETDTEEKIIRRVECDLFYLRSWSVLFDLYIIALTVLKVPFDKNAY